MISNYTLHQSASGATCICDNPPNYQSSSRAISEKTLPFINYRRGLYIWQPSTFTNHRLAVYRDTLSHTTSDDRGDRNRVAAERSKCSVHCTSWTPIIIFTMSTILTYIKNKSKLVRLFVYNDLIQLYTNLI